MVEISDRAVVDASVAFKWLVPERQSDAALRLFHVGALLAPSHLPVEVASAIWKNVRRGEISSELGTMALAETLRLPVVYFDSRELLDQAFSLAARYDRTIYDALYVALALQQRCPLVTADLRLFNALAEAFVETMLWVEDIPDLGPESA
jgi:predicted nucleic acid-binding protein